MSKQIIGVLSLKDLQSCLQSLSNFIQTNKYRTEMLLTQWRKIFMKLTHQLNRLRQLQLFMSKPGSLNAQIEQTTKKNENKKKKKMKQHIQKVTQSDILNTLSQIFKKFCDYELNKKNHNKLTRFTVLSQIADDMQDCLGSRVLLDIIIQTQLIQKIKIFTKSYQQQKIKPLDDPSMSTLQLIKICNIILRILNSKNQLSVCSPYNQTYIQIQDIQIYRGQLLVCISQLLPAHHKSGLKPTKQCLQNRQKQLKKQDQSCIWNQLIKQTQQNIQVSKKKSLFVNALQNIRRNLLIQIEVRLQEISRLKKIGSNLIQLFRHYNQSNISFIVDSYEPLKQFSAPFCKYNVCADKLMKSGCFWLTIFLQIIMYCRINSRLILSNLNEESVYNLDTTFISQQSTTNYLSNQIRHILKGIFSLVLEKFKRIYEKFIRTKSQKNSNTQNNNKNALKFIDFLVRNQHDWCELKNDILKRKLADQVNQLQTLDKNYEEDNTRKIFQHQTLDTLDIFASNGSNANFNTTKNINKSDQNIMMQLLKKTKVTTKKLAYFINQYEQTWERLQKFPKQDYCNFQKFTQQVYQLIQFNKQCPQESIKEVWNSQSDYNRSQWKFFRQFYRYSMLSIVQLKKKQLKQNFEKQTRKYNMIELFKNQGQLFRASLPKKKRKTMNKM